MSTLSESVSPAAVIQSLSITFSAEQRSVEVPPGTSILQAARLAGVLIDAPCNERGKCGKCRVRVIAGEAGELSENERRLLGPLDLDAGIRLACEAKPFASITVEIPATSRNMAHRKATAVLPRPIAALPFTQSAACG